MGLELKFSICQSGDCLSFEFTEETGIYDVNSNAGGWGTPNITIGEVIAAELVITTPTGGAVIDIYPIFPDSTGLQIHTVNATSLGTALIDGLYTVVYNVYNDVLGVQTLAATTTKIFLLSCTIKCCVDKLVAKVASCGCDCDSPTVKDALLASALYQSLLLAGGCGKTYQVTNILERLNKLCTLKKCGCNQTSQTNIPSPVSPS